MEASKSSIKDLFKDLLDEIKGFQYQITVKVLLRKDKKKKKKKKKKGDIEFAPVYFNFTTKTVTNFKYHLHKSFQEVLYKIDYWINEGTGWVIEIVDAEYVNISIYTFPYKYVHYLEVYILNYLIN